jgi:hypothetical protein
MIPTALGKPGVRERVAQLMRMEPRQASLLTPAPHELLDAPGGQPAALAKPQPGKVSVLVPGADAQVAVQRHGGLAAVGQGTLAAALAEHERHVQVQVEVGELEVSKLAAAGAGVEQEHHDGGIPAGLEVLAGAGRQQPPQIVLGHDWDGLLGHDRRPHPRHRAGGDLLFLLQPAVQHTQTPVASGDGLRRPALEQLAQERLQVLAAGVQ